MDLSFFISSANADVVGPVRDQIGLYIVSQKLLPPAYKNMYRCGAAGTKELIDGEAGNKSSSFRSRLGMYLSNFITDGLIHACLTVPRSIFMGFSQKAIKRQDGDNREDYQLPSKTRLQIRERGYHDELERLGVKRVRPKPNEWFEGNIRTIKRALQSIGTGTYYEFVGNRPPLVSELKKTTQERLDKVDSIVEFTHRRSPRLMEVAMDGKNIEELRRAGKKGRAIARALAQLT